MTAGLDLILPDWIGAPAHVGALATGRSGGISKPPFDDGAGGGGLNLGANAGDEPDAVAHNRQLLTGLLPAEPVWLQQVHGNVVIDAGRLQGSKDPIVADAAFATRPGVVCAVTTADCLPVLLCDVQGRVVAAAHAGWRGLAGGILQQTVGAMQAAGAGQLLAWMGPTIGPAHFEVGEEVFRVFVDRDARADAAFRPVPQSGGKYLADLYHLARLILGDCGVLRIAGGRFDTAGDRATATGALSGAGPRFYSYRRDHRTGRMATLIWLR